MKVDVLTEIEIDRPQTEVARFAGDPSNAPPWYVNIASVNWVTPPPLAVGSRMAFVARFISAGWPIAYEIVELIPGERLVMRTAQGAFPASRSSGADPPSATSMVCSMP